MSALSIQPTYPIFTDIDGQPLEAGYVWIGTSNLDPQVNPINVYWDAALTIQAAQPIRTLAGYPSRNGTPARLYVNSDYSIRVMNRNGSAVYSSPAATERYSAAVVVGIDATNVSFTSAGSGAVTRTAQDKMRESVSVKDFGAVGDGVTDDTAAFNAALAASDSVFVPTGTYLVNNVTGIRSGSDLFGEGWNSILKQISTAGGNDHILDIRHNASGGSASTSDNFRNIRIRDLQVRGPADAPVFNEHCHLIAMCAVSEVTIENVYFYAFKGDGLYIGSGDTPNIERHNERVTVRKCLFDGVNKANRNGISIIDCDTVLIEDNVFQNTTASNMPGAVDIEPNAWAWHTVFNVTVRKNRFNNCKAGVVVVIPDYFTYPAHGFYIESNYINLCGTGIGIENSNASAPGSVLSDGSVDTDMHITNNHVVACGTPISMTGVKQCFIEKNLFEDCTSHAVFGSSVFNRIRSRDVFILENKFMRCGSASAYGCRIDGITNLKFNGNKFTDCGTGVSPSAAVDFFMQVPNSVSNFEFIGNAITTPTGKTLSAVTRSGSTTFTIDRARVFGNQFSSLASIFAEARGYVTRHVVVNDSGGTPYDLTIDLPPAATSGNVTHIVAGWTHRGSASHYAQYVGVVLRGDSNADQVLAISQTGSAGHSIAVQSATTTSVTLRLTYSFNGTLTATVFG